VLPWSEESLTSMVLVVVLAVPLETARSSVPTALEASP
jgi:hypothetical protein